ncbi:MAG: ATP-binding protein, partial [Acidobacteriota bacterium]
GLELAVDALDTERERLTRRVDNLLTLARLEAGLARPRPEPVPPAEILRAAREALHATLHGHSVETTVAADCPELLVDAPLTVEIVVNLLENAARASGSGAPLELAAAADASSLRRVIIQVMDRGPGLPRGVRARFAVPGARRQTALEFAAGGLGLEIADSLARAQGGELMLIERLGGGTVARLQLPAAPELAAEGEVA